MRQDRSHLFLASRLFGRLDWLTHKHELVLGENEEIEDVQDPAGVDEKESEEPVAIAVSGGFPEGETRPDE